MIDIKPSSIDYSKPKYTLTISETVDGELYATIKANNSKTICIISESYKHKNTLVNALRYISKPDIIKFDLPSKHWKYVRKLEMMIDKLWE